MKKSAKISVIIPTHNRSSSLKKTLISLINQTYPKDRYEIIIVDDGGSDNTEKMIKELNKQTNSNINYFWQKNRGPAAARNLGIKNARADIIAFTDDEHLITNSKKKIVPVPQIFVDIYSLTGLAPKYFLTEIIKKYPIFKFEIEK